MRFNLRIKLGRVTFFLMLSKTQRLKGITSKIGKDEHIIFWDLEGYEGKGVTLDSVKDELQRVQRKFGLSDIYITSDKADVSWHGYCFSKVKFKTFIQILCDTEFVDWNFIYWTIVRGEATLRISRKEGRPAQSVVAYLPSYSVEIPKNLKHIIYDTGSDKRGKSIVLG